MSQSKTERETGRSRRLVDLFLALGLATFALFSYLRTLTPGLSHISFDGPEITTIPHELGLLHPPGYPLYVWVGWLFTKLPVGDVAQRMNLFSAVAAALSVALVYAMVRLLTKSQLAGLLAGLFWMSTTTLWSQAVITEVYAPSVLALAAVLAIALVWAERWRTKPQPDGITVLLFGSLWFGIGMSLGAHLSNLAFLPGLLCYVALVDRRVLYRPTMVGLGSLMFGISLLQFLWLPARAGHLADPNVFTPPTSLDSFLDYTVFAFSEFRWAFPIDQLPDRMEMYSRFVYDNFGPVGIGLALLGAIEIARLRTREFVLLGAGYLIEVVYFLEYDVNDVDVFFIPAHLITVVCIGFGVWRLGRIVEAAIQRTAFARGDRWGPARGLLIAGVLIIPIVFTYDASYSDNDRSSDTVIGDFYDAVFDTLPEQSTLMSLLAPVPNDLYYFRDVERRREDVTIPSLPRRPDAGTSPTGDRVYTVWQPVLTSNDLLFPPQLWFVPVLVAPIQQAESAVSDRPLILHRLSQSPPQDLIVTDAKPDRPVGVQLNGVTLLGITLAEDTTAAGGLLDVRLYWQAPNYDGYTVTVELENSEFRELHRIGFGNVSRYLDTVDVPEGSYAVVEKFQFVVPSGLPPGVYDLIVGVGLGRHAERPESVAVASIEVRDAEDNEQD